MARRSRVSPGPANDETDHGLFRDANLALSARAAAVSRPDVGTCSLLQLQSPPLLSCQQALSQTVAFDSQNGRLSHVKKAFESWPIGIAPGGTSWGTLLLACRFCR